MLRILLLLGAHLLMTGLPITAAMFLAARRGVTSTALLLCIGLAAGGSLAMLDFWCFYATPVVGKIVSYTALVASLGFVCYSISAGDLDGALLKRIATPMVLWIAGSVFLVFLGFLHGGAGQPEATSAIRFTTDRLPSDDDIPQFFTGWFFQHGHKGIPPIYPGNWMASDRPPLQIGYELLQRTWGWDTKTLNYELVGVCLQQQWILALWALLTAARVRALSRALAMIAVLVSDVALVNGFYVWPKMLPAAMVIAAATLIITPLWSDVRRSRGGATLVAALFALAMLGHGSSVFPLVALVIFAVFRERPSWGWLAVAVAAAAVLYVPWSSYQKYGDPPGNRLLKWQLAGDLTINHMSASGDIRRAYVRAGLEGTLHNKTENFAVESGGGMAISLLRTVGTDLLHGDVRSAILQMQTLLYVYPLPSLGFFALAPLLLVVARCRRRADSDEWAFVVAGSTCLMLGAVVWALILFGNGPSRAVMWQGSFALPVLALALCVVGLRVYFPRLAILVLALNLLLTIVICGPSLQPTVGTAYEPIAFLLSAVGLGGFTMVALRAEGRSDPPIVPSRSLVAVASS
jgi:hypothetical protein